MRATNFEVLGQTFTLAFPQDGVDQPATYINKLSTRAASPTLTALSRPVAGNPMSAVADINLTIPVVVTDPVTGDSVVKGLNRYKISARQSEFSTDTQKTEDFNLIVALLAEPQIAAVIKDSERLI